jgi:hypothetical protein
MKKLNVHRLIEDVYHYREGIGNAEAKLLDFAIESFRLLEDRIKSRSENANGNLIASNNFLVNLTTAIEIFFQVLIESSSKWSEKGIKKLLNEPIILVDAYQLFKHPDVTREYIVSRSYNFQNFDEIQKVMCELSGKKDFFSSMERFIPFGKFLPKVSAKPLVSIIPNWRDTFKNLLEKRNSYIHKGLRPEISIKDLRNYYFFVLSFGLFVQAYCDSLKIKNQKP